MLLEFEQGSPLKGRPVEIRTPGICETKSVGCPVRLWTRSAASRRRERCSGKRCLRLHQLTAYAISYFYSDVIRRHTTSIELRRVRGQIRCFHVSASYGPEEAPRTSESYYPCETVPESRFIVPTPMLASLIRCLQASFIVVFSG